MNDANRPAPGSAVCDALAPFGTSIFTDITALVGDCGAVNLSQGFPDFDGPLEIREMAARQILRGPNQYAPPDGVPALRFAVAAKMKRFYGVEVCPDTGITATGGATGGLAATLLGLLNPGDEVVLIEPFYDLYPAMVRRAGAVPVYVPLRNNRLDADDLAAVFGPKTRAIIINNPQNPCGHVYSRAELDAVAALCSQYDTVAIGDEVYEHILFDGRTHTPLLAVDGLRERSVVVSSTAKTFSMTGWKTGYAIASPRLTAAVRAAHQFIAYCIPGMFQTAMAAAIALPDDYYDGLKEMYGRRREMLCNILSDAGLTVLLPEGTYYATVDISRLDFEDDLAFVRHLARNVGVGAIPSSFFYQNRRGGRHLVRFCFCKSDDTLRAAAERLSRHHW